MKFTLTKFGNHLNEITQNLDIKFSFARKLPSGNYTNIHSLVKCRDFLGDVLHSVENKKPVSIYGFKFDPKKQELPYKNKTLLYMSFPTKKDYSNFLLDDLWKIEDDLKIRRTILHPISNTSCLIEGSRLWSQSIVGISFYTFVLKCSTYQRLDPDFWTSISMTTYNRTAWDGTLTNVPTVESRYVKVTKEYLPLFLKHFKSLVKNMSSVSGLETNEYIGTIHNNSGFKSVICNHSGEVGQRFAALKQATK